MRSHCKFNEITIKMAIRPPPKTKILCAPFLDFKTIFTNFVAKLCSIILFKLIESQVLLAVSRGIGQIFSSWLELGRGWRGRFLVESIFCAIKEYFVVA